jgi:hypothetical protein
MRTTLRIAGISSNETSGSFRLIHLGVPMTTFEERITRKCLFGNRHPHLCPNKKMASYPDFVCTTKNSLLQNDGLKTGEASGLI